MTASIRNRTPRATARWLNIRDVADALEVSTQTARRLVRNGTIPGGEVMYRFEGRNGERWHVDRETFERWRSLQAATATG